MHTEREAILMSKHDEKEDTVHSCGCIKAKALDTGHYCKITLDFELALSLATDCFDMCDLDERKSRTLH